MIKHLYHFLKADAVSVEEAERMLQEHSYEPTPAPQIKQERSLLASSGLGSEADEYTQPKIESATVKPGLLELCSSLKFLSSMGRSCGFSSGATSGLSSLRTGQARGLLPG
jgi:hypothetical protein